MNIGERIIQPPYLKAGDKVALVSPAYWVPQEAILQAAETILSWGLQPVLGPHINNLNVNAYAGTADEFQIVSNQEPATSLTRNILFGTNPRLMKEKQL